jgi:hypothetical protein
MNRFHIALLVATTVATSAMAQTLAEISQFAQSICGDIPEGSLTKNSIQGKVHASAPLLARIVSGNVGLDANRIEEIYRGIPLNKLPDNIPTVAMCKSHLTEIIFSARTAQPVPGPSVNQSNVNGNDNQTTNNYNK